MSFNIEGEAVNRRLRAALEATSDHVVLLDRDFRVLYVNRKVADLNGVEPDHYIGRTHWEAWPSSAETRVETALRGVVRTGQPTRLEHNHAGEGGLDLWLEIDAVPSEDGLAIFFRDVTRRRLAEDLLRATADAVTSLVSYVDADLVYRFCNRRYEEWYGRSREEIVGKPMREIVGESAFAAALPRIERALAGEVVSYEDWIELAGPGRRYLRVVYSPRRTLGGRVEGIHTQVEDETESRLAQEALAEAKASLEDANARLERLAATDHLTGLKNARAFRERLVEEFAEARRLEHDLSLILVDVDLFKSYNDAFGHPAGDVALKNVAEVLRSQSRAYDVAARYGGEEFALLLPSTGSAEAAAAAERVRKAVEAYDWPLRPVTVSLGVATLCAQAEAPDELVEQSDRALYAAKQRGRNRVEVADSPGW